MTYSTDELEAHIEQTRDDLGANLQALETKVKSMADWRGFVRRKPLLVTGILMGAAVLLGVAWGRQEP